MTDYSELIKALRCCISKNPPETCVGCTYSKCNNECAVRRMILDAAAAIEALQATIELMNPHMPDFFPDADKAVLPKMEVQE